MKKIINLKRIVILTLLLVLGSTTICFADMYISTPTEDFALSTIPFLEIAFIILSVVLVIDLVCMGVGKINNSAELISKTKNIAENLCYCILILLGLISSVVLLAGAFILCIIPFIVMFLSVYLRLKIKNKKGSYIIIGMYLTIILLILLKLLMF